MHGERLRNAMEQFGDTILSGFRANYNDLWVSLRAFRHNFKHVTWTLRVPGVTYFTVGRRAELSRKIVGLLLAEVNIDLIRAEHKNICPM